MSDLFQGLDSLNRQTTTLGYDFLRLVPPGTLKAAALGPLLALALAGLASAQTYDALGDGLTVGHFILHPSMAFEYTYDDNILFTSTDVPGSDPVASGVVVARARLLADLPVRDNRFRLAYAPFYRNYTNNRFRPEDRLNQEANMEALFHTGRAIALALRDHYVNGTVSLQEQRERNGSSVGLGHYTTHDPHLDIGVNLGARQGVSLLSSYSRSSYNGLVSGLGQVTDYAYTTRKIEGRYNYKLSEPTTFYGYTAFEKTLQTRTGFTDVTIRSRATGLGLTRTINQNIVTNLSAGYQTLDFEGGIATDFQGPTAEANVIWQVQDVTRFDFGLLRKPFPSIFLDSNYYIDTEGRVRWTRQIGRSTYVDATVALQENQYVPLSGTARRERLIRLELGTGHRFLRNLRGYLGFNVERRESNAPQLSGGGGGADPFHYQLYRVLFRLEAGWL